jgi:hypothetical protein
VPTSYSSLGVLIVRTAAADARAEASINPARSTLVVNVRRSALVLEVASTELLSALNNSIEGGVREGDRDSAVRCSSRHRDCTTVDGAVFVTLDELKVEGNNAQATTSSLSTFEIVKGRRTVCERRLRLQLGRSEGTEWRLERKEVLSTC